MKGHRDTRFIVREHKRGTWTHGLCRLSNGQIVVAECFSCGGFVVKGVYGENNELYGRLYPGEKLTIAKDVLYGCLEYIQKHDPKFLREHNIIGGGK